MEVGARGYCADSFRVCLVQLGFGRKSINPILRKLSLTAIQSSFTIWLAHNSKTWEQPDSIDKPFIPPNLVPKATKAEGKTHQKKPVKFVISPSVKVASQQQTTVASLVNKGNTCYVNAIVQALFSLPRFWSSFLSDTSNVSGITASFLKLMNSLRISKLPIDPSPFLTNLQNFMIANANPEFRFNEQQDAAEILQVL